MTSWLSPGDLLALALFLLRHAAPVLAGAALAAAVGATLTRRLSWGSATERAVLSAGLGLAVLAHVLLALGLLGLLTRAGVAASFAGLAALSISGSRELFRLIRHAGEGRLALGIAAAAVVLAPAGLLSLYPPTAFDATMYHLPYAKAFVASGGLPFLASLRFPIFPQLGELLYAALMLFSGDVAAQGLQWVWTLLTGALLFVWGRDAFSPASGALAAALYLGIPMVVFLAGSGYIEPPLTYFSLAALYSFRRWRRSAERGWLVVSAVLAGSAAATKYLGLFWVLALGFGLLVAKVPSDRRRALALYAGVVALVLAPWYVRIASHTESPVFPYLPGVFGSSEWDLGSHQPRIQGVAGVGEGILATLRLPWDVVFEGRRRFGPHPPFSPWLLPAALLALLAAWRDDTPRRLLLLAAAYAFGVGFGPPDPRYLLPAAALLALPAGAGADRLRSMLRSAWSRRAALAVAAALLLLPGWVYGVRLAWRQGPVPLDRAARDAYLGGVFPGYRALAHLNRIAGERYSVYVFFAESMAYYASGRFWGDWFGPGRYARVLEARSAESLHGTLRALGVTHLLVLAAAPPDIPFADPRFAELFSHVYTDGHARIYELRLTARSSRTTSGPP